MWCSQKRARKSSIRAHCGFSPLIFLNLGHLERYIPKKRHEFLRFSVEKKAYHFSKRALRVSTTRNNWLKSALAIQIKLQSNFIEISPPHRCSPVHLLHIFRALFPKNTSALPADSPMPLGHEKTIDKWKRPSDIWQLTLSWQRPISYRNQSIDLLCKSMDWFLYDIGLPRERVKRHLLRIRKCKFLILQLRNTFYRVTATGLEPTTT